MKRCVWFGLLLCLAMAAPATTAAQQTTVILVRHAEKMDGSGDVALTDQGKARAARLAELLRHAGISAVYSTPFERTRGTAQPIAQALGLDIIATPISSAAAYAPGLAQQILRDFNGKTVLVVGHSNTTPDVVRALGAPPVPAIPDQEYDNLYVVLIDAGGKAQLIRAKY